MKFLAGFITAFIVSAAERMPIARSDNASAIRNRFLNQLIDQWDDLIAIGNR